MYSGVQLDPIPKNNSLLEISMIIGFFKSLQMIIGTYDGWNAVCFFEEEDENPSRNIPRSLYSGAIIVMIIYVLLNIAFFHVLSVASLANSPLAAADVAKEVFGSYGSVIVTLIAIFSLISILNAYLMIPTRILFGLSRDGFYIQKGATVNQGGTPIVALLISAGFALVLICIGSFEVLFSFATFMSVIVWGLTYCALIKLRVSEPNLPRPFRSWGYPWTTIFMIVATIALLVGFAFSDRQNFFIIIGITVLSYPVFLLINGRNKKV